MIKHNSKTFYLMAGVSAGLLGSLLVQAQRARKKQQWQSHATIGTALITGASSGIGADFARHLAYEGYNLILVARRVERLQALAQELQALQAALQVEVLPADLAKPEDIERVAEVIADRADLSLLVNNAGFGTGGSFVQLDIQPELDMIRVHVTASERLTRAALPGMIARAHGAVINVSSLSAFLPLVGSSTYSATKAFLNSFSESLQVELAGTGVRIQALCPGMTVTEFHDQAGITHSRIPSFMWMSSDAVVMELLRGLREGRVIVVPGTLNKLLALLFTSPLHGSIIRLTALFQQIFAPIT